MRKIYLLGLYLFLGLSLSGIDSAFAQLKEEVQEKTLLETKKLQKPAPDFKVYATSGIFSGYDSNVRLTTIRKGDIFEEAMFSLDFLKPLGGGFKFVFNYDLDALNYNECTDVSNILNHLRMGPEKKFGMFTVGTGYDVGYYYYHHNADASFVFQKAYLFLMQDLSKKTYHRLQIEAGYKGYTDGKAMGDTIGSVQDKTRADKRLEV